MIPKPFSRASALLLALGFGAFGAFRGYAETERTFTNPILPGFHADPSVCRVGDDYYMVHSTFEYFPGVPIFHSRDLIHWQPIGYCLTRKSQLNLDKMRASGGIFAPTIRHHDGTFYMITTLVWGGGNFYVTAKDPKGPWSDPIWLDSEGIDPSLFFDDDGKVYYTRQVDGERGYSGQQLLNLKTRKLEGEIRELWRGTGGVWPEGPHLYKIDGKYYLMISEGGTSYDHSITIARSDSPWGPFEPNPDNPILTHRRLVFHKFQGLGHGDLVNTPDGWWIVCLGFRPQGGKFHHLGRETFLAPVTWNESGWLEINGGKPIPVTLPAPKLEPHLWPQEPARDDFEESKFRLCWNWLRNPVESDYSLTQRPGWLRLHGSAVTLSEADSPTFIAQRQTALSCLASARLSFHPKKPNEEAGIVLRGNDRNHYEAGVTLRNDQRQVFFRQVLDGKALEPVDYVPLSEGDVTLSVRAEPLHYSFFYQVGNGEEVELGSALTRDLSSEVLSGQNTGFNFTGVYVGMYATGNGERCTTPADFDWFELELTD